MTTRSSVLISGSMFVLALAAGLAARPAAQNRNAALQGVWRTVEVTMAGRVLKPGATLAIFHGSHYSRVEEHVDAPRPLIADPTTASADELRATWGPFVGEAGTFELGSNNVITMQATVAKNPAAMKQGAVSVYTWQRDGNTLTLTQVRTYAGAPASPLTVKLTRVE